MIGLSRKKNMHKFIAWVTLAVFSLQPVGAAAQAVADPNAPSANRPTVASAQNGTPVVQIATPSAAGVSRNLYQQFDIASNGLILNNSYQLSKTQLAGYIQGNPNLAGGAARLILNEVTGSNSSNLRGYLEVAGQRADVIIANRNGIVGNGFGFINTNRGVLTTGVPVFGGSGSLDAFRVTGGEISVQGDGINATGADRVDLISRAVSVNAGIWAKELNVVTGSNNVVYDTLGTQAIAGEGAQPQVALDVSALGGMYANKIKLVGTERGVGVNSQGAISATSGDLMLTNEGKITLSGQTNATGNLTINSTDTLTNQGTTYAQGNTSVIGSTVINSGVLAAGQNTQIAAQTINSTGTLAAGLRSDGTIGTSGDLSLAASGAVTATGKNIAAGNLNETGAAIDHSGATTYAGNAANITATSGDINHTGATLQAGGALTMSAAGTIKNDKSANGIAGQMTAGNIAITTGNISNQGGSILQTGAGITKLNIANSLDNTGGTIHTAGDLTVTAAAVTNTGGQLIANQQLNLTANNLNGNGQTLAGQDLNLSLTGDLTNSAGGELKANRDLTLTVGGTVTNQGNITAVRNATLQARNITNATGATTATGNALQFVTAADIHNNGQINAATTAALTGANFTNTGTVTANGLTVQADNLTNSGTAAAINSAGAINLTIQNALLNQGTIYAQGNTDIQAVHTLTNSGVLAAAQNTAIAAEIVASTGALGAGIQSNGGVGTVGNLTITTSGSLTTQGQTLAGGDLTLTGSTVDLTGGKTYAGNTANITAISGDVNNTGGDMAANGALTVTASGNATNDTGKLRAGKVTVTTQTITNKGGVIQQNGAEATTLKAGGSLDNTGGTIASNGDNLTLQSSSLTNQNGQIQHAGSGSLSIIGTNGVTNTGGKIAGNGQINMETQTLDNTQGSLVAQQALALTAAAVTNSQGFLAGDTVNLTAQGTVDNSRGAIQANKNLLLTAQTLNNQNGSILSLDHSGASISVDQTLQNANGLIGANGAITLTGASLGNQSGQVLAQGTLTVNAGQGIDNTGGKLLSQQDLTLNQGSAALNNDGGTMSATKNLTLQAGTVNNTNGNFTAGNDIALTTQQFSGANGKITAGRDVTLTVNGDYLQGSGSQTQANRDINLTVSGTATNQGNMTAVRNARLQAAGINNQAGATLSAGEKLQVSATGDVNNSGRFDGNTVTVQGQNVNNTGTVTANSLTVQATNIRNTGDAAILATTGDMNLNAPSTVENKDGANIYSMGNITIAGSERRDGNGQPLDRANSLLNQSATIEADGNIGIYANDITNKKRIFEVGQTVVSDETNSTLVDHNIWVSAKVDHGTCPYDVSVLYENLLDPNTAILIAPQPLPKDLLDEVNLVKTGISSATWMMGQTVTETNFIQDSPEGKLTAGGNISLRANTINNNNSSVVAVGTLDAKGTINNTSQGRVRTTTRHLADTNLLGYLSASGEDDEEYDSSVGKMLYGVQRQYDQTTYEQLPGSTSIFNGGQQVIINGPSVNNITKNPTNVTGGNFSTLQSTQQTNVSKIQTVLGNTTLQGNSSLGQGGATSINSSNTAAGTQASMNLTLPANGLYSIHKEPSSHYLVETDPRFANYGTFISSDYMLSQLNLDPAKTMKLVGDAFYQQKLIRDQISELTGKQSLSGYSSTNEEYKALLTNGATYAKQFNLQVGVALTAEQMAQLTSDMVWMVEQEVQGQTVLVPVVYLAPNHMGSLTASGAIIAGDHVSITADQDIVNQSGTISGGTVNLVAGQDIKNETTTYVAQTGDNLSAGNDIRVLAGQTAGISATGNLTINAGRDVDIIGGKISAGTDLTLDAGRSLTVGATVTTDNTTAKNYRYDATTNIASSITAGNNLTMTSRQDVNLSGVQVAAGKDVTLTSSLGTVNINSVQDEESVDKKKELWWGVNPYQKATTTNVVSSITAGNNVAITSQQDTNLSGAQVAAGQNLTLQSTAGNVNLTAVKDETLEDQKVGSSSHWKRTRTDDETVIGSSLQAGGNITVSAVTPSSSTTVNPSSGNITLAGSTIHSDTGHVAIDADNNVTVTAVTEKHESLVQKHTEDSGFFSSTTTDTRDYSLTNEVKGSTLSGDTVSVTSGKDLTVKGSNVVATNDVNLKAGNDVTITSAQETGADEHYKKVEKSGLFSGGGLGFTIGSQSTTTNLNEHVKDEIGSTVGSIAGNVTITAGNNVKSEGTTVASGKDTTITGKNVSIDNTINTYDSQYKYEFKQSGLTVSLGGGILTPATDAAADITRGSDVADSRLKTLYAYKAVKDLQAAGSLLTENNGKLKAGVSIGVSIGSSQSTLEETVHTETANISNINAGGDVTIKATAGDANFTGTKINGNNINIEATNNINITGAQNKQQTDTKTSSSSWSVGGNIGVGYFGNASKGSGKENENATTNVSSVIDANGTTTVKSGQDTNIIASQVKGEKVVAQVGGNLNIASRQDTDDYTAKNQNSGIGFTTGQVDGKPLPAGVAGPVNKVASGGVTGSVSTGKTDSTYTSVTEQAGIYAGKDGFDINVGKNTDLKGAVIASEATPDKNKISTDTLTFSDIQNKAHYSSSSIGANYDSHQYNPGDKDYKNQGLTPNIGVTASGNSDSTTKSAISPGTIIVGGKKVDPVGLSRDTTNSLNALGKIFDKKTVQEQQELAKLFGEVAFKAVGDLGLKEGSTEKTAIDSIVGGIMSQMAGGGFASGAASSGLTQIVTNELCNIKDPAVRQWVTYLVGAIASTLVDGNAQTGGSIAVSQIRNNLFEHLAQYLANIFKDKIKAGVNSLISNGIIPAPDDMKQDYYIYMGGASLPIKLVSCSSGYIVDKMANVYGLFEADASLGVSTPITVTTGFGNFYNAPKDTRQQYIDAIEGFSAGGGGSSGVQMTISVSPSGTLSTEATATPAAGVTFFSGRYVKYLFNLND